MALDGNLTVTFKIFLGPPTCAILFDGPNQTGAYTHLAEGEMMCCTPPIMPLNDISESVYVTPATGWILIISFFKDLILDFYQ